MGEIKPNSRDRRIAELQAQVLELQTRLAECDKLRTERERALLEDGLRLSQENEFLRKELTALKKLP